MDEAWDTRDEMKSKIIKRDAVDAAGNERKNRNGTKAIGTKRTVSNE